MIDFLSLGFGESHQGLPAFCTNVAALKAAVPDVPNPQSASALGSGGSNSITAYGVVPLSSRQVARPT